MLPRIFFAIVYALCVFSFLPCAAQATEPPFRLPFCAAEGCGYLDANGRWAVAPDFDLVRPFPAHGPALVQKGDRPAFITRDGRLLTPPDLTELSPYAEDRAAAAVNKLYGFLDPSGAWAVEPGYENVTDFSNGRAFVQKDGMWSCIDAAGKPVSPLHFNRIAATEDESDGLTPALYNGHWGYIDAQCRWAVPPRFDDLGPFSEGLAAAQINGHWGYIDRTGREVIAPAFEDARPFSEGRALVVRGDKAGFVDKAGSTVIPLELAVLNTQSFSEGLAAACIDDTACGIMDSSGAWLVQPRPFTAVFSFSDGLAAVCRLFGTCGFVDKKGRPVTESVFDFEGSDTAFTDKLARLALRGPGGLRWGLMGADGAWRFEPTLTQLRPFAEGLAAACAGPDRCGYLDAQGRWAVAPTLESVDDFAHGLALAADKNFFGLLDAQGSWTAAPLFAQAYRAALPFCFPDWKAATEKPGEVLIAPARFRSAFACPPGENILSKWVGNAAWAAYLGGRWGLPLFLPGGRADSGLLVRPHAQGLNLHTADGRLFLRIDRTEGDMRITNASGGDLDRR